MLLIFYNIINTPEVFGIMKVFDALKSQVVKGNNYSKKKKITYSTPFYFSDFHSKGRRLNFATCLPHYSANLCSQARQ